MSTRALQQDERERPDCAAGAAVHYFRPGGIMFWLQVVIMTCVALGHMCSKLTFYIHLKKRHVSHEKKIKFLSGFL
jgi:hypothetical protein